MFLLKLNRCTSNTGELPPTVGRIPIFAMPSRELPSIVQETAYTPLTGKRCLGIQRLAVGMPMVLPNC